MEKRLQGKIGLISGAGSGIGKAIALRFAKEGADLALNDINEENLDKVIMEVKQFGVKCLKLMGDVSEVEEVKLMVEKFFGFYSHLDILVNNAGITRDNLMMKMKEDAWKEVIQTNLVGVYELTELVIPHMKKQQNGKIVNISSIVGVYGNAGQCNYSTAKAGVISLSKIKAKELMPQIQVNCIAPGLVETDMTSGFELQKLSATKLGRAAQAKDIADCALWLVKQGDYITGQVIEIDGGLSLWSSIQDLWQ